MTSEDQTFLQRTATAMHDTAEQLETTEANLHRTAEDSPDPAITARLHALANEVTTQAKAIDRRAHLLTRTDTESSSL